MARAKDPTKHLLTGQQIQVCEYYRKSGGIVEFLLDLTSPKDKPLRIPMHQEAILRSMYEYSFSYVCAARRLAKTFCIGNYIAALGAILSGMPGEYRIGLYSGTMRQVGLNFRELRRAFDRSPFLQSITFKEPKRSQEYYEWILKGYEGGGGAYHKGVEVYGFPLGAAQKSSTSRGFGFTIMIIDEFQLMPEGSYAALLPTAATSEDPMEDVLRYKELQQSLKHESKDNKIWTPPKFEPQKNRLIFAGTAFWQFHSSYGVFSEWKAASRLNRSALKLLQWLDWKYPTEEHGEEYRKRALEVIGMMPLEEKVSFIGLQESEVPITGKISKAFIDYLRSKWSEKKYMVFQMPWTVAPKGWYSEDFMDMMKKTMSPAEIDMEFKCMWLADSDGPFPASLLERATDPDLDIELKGDNTHQYIVGVDPATANKLGLVVLKVVDRGDYKGVELVYCREYDVTDEAMGHPNQVRLVFDALSRFGVCRACVIDHGGGGKSISESMAEQSDIYSAWKSFAQPALSFGNERHTTLRGKQVVWVVPMTNPMTTETNNRMISDLQSGRFSLAGKFASRAIDSEQESGLIREEDRVYDDIRRLKGQMQQLVRLLSGMQVKFDLPSDPSSPQHIHDLWSALTLAYKGFIELEEGTELDEGFRKLPKGFWLAA